MADPIKRLNYFKHQFLRASDFIDEQKYHIDMRRRHNRSLHTWGIAGNGLKVTFAQGATGVTVSQGVAVDSQGREIVLIEDKAVDLSGFPAGTALYITIAYGERTTNPSNETGAQGDTRWTEEPVITPMQAKPGDVSTNIVLGRVTRNGTTVSGVDETERRSAGVEAGELTVRTLTLSQQTVDASAWPRLTCSAANQASLANSSLRMDNGREIFFADGGQLRSLDNAHRIVFNRPNNRLELQEFGDIIFMTGGANPAERMRVGGNGNVGIGVGGTADAALHIAGGQWDLTNTEGDLKIGNAAIRLKMGIALGGGGGDARIRAVGGMNRLMIGAGNSDTLTILGGNVGLGTVVPGARLEINGDLLFKADPAAADDPGDIVFQSANGAQKARVFAPPQAGAGLLFAVGDNTSRLAINAAGNVAIGANFTNAQADLHISSDEPHIRIDTTGNRSVIQWARKGALLWDFGVGRDATNTDFWFGDFSAYRLIIQKGTGNVGIGANVVPQRILHVEGSEVHSGGGGSGYSFASRDTNGGAFVENGAGGARWVWYAAGGVARLWSAGADRINVNTSGELRTTGAVYAGNSDIYFTADNHTHTGIGNAVGWAAIENASNPEYNALMVLGRMTQTRIFNVTINRRIVKVWDYLEVNGDLTVTGSLRVNGSKQGYVVDDFINRHGDALEQGDVVVIGDTDVTRFHGANGSLPVPEVDLAQDAYDARVCGIVDVLTVSTDATAGGEGAAAEDDKAAKKSRKKDARKEDAAEPLGPGAGVQTFTPAQAEDVETTKVGPNQFGTMVTHGAYAFCKVDADIAPIKVGDMLTTSPTKGHAQKVLDPSKAAGAVIGKALASLKKGRGKIPVLVTLQ